MQFARKGFEATHEAIDIYIRIPLQVDHEKRTEIY